MANRHSWSPIVATVFSLTLSLTGLRAADTPPAPVDAAPATPNTEAVPPPAAPAATPAPAADATTEAVAPAPAGARPTTYTVMTGDSYWVIAQKFNISVKHLKKANGATTNNLKPGQVIKIPPIKPATTKKSAPKATTTSIKPKTPASKLAASSVTPKASHLHSTSLAQPVQDFDVPTSTFASCPVPPPTEVPPPEEVSPAPSQPAMKLATDGSYEKPSEVAPTPPAQSHVARPVVAAVSQDSSPGTAAAPASTAPAPFFSSFAKLFHSDPLLTTPTSEWSGRFLEQSRNLGNLGIDYDESWCPPGESRAWAMDCSNTSRYLYKVTTGIQLPRTASDQYYYLHLQDKAWDVPLAANGMADCNYLRHNLKPGDLLFWENTYKPERQPPITHVMVFLGSNDKGQWIMAGSQTGRGGEHNRRHGGPDIYVFDPTKPCGGYSSWLGMVHHQGRFCAYGRPLEADASKLAVAAND